MFEPVIPPQVLRHFKAGDLIFKQSDPGDLMYIVKSGSVVLQLDFYTEHVKADGFFGEMSLLNHELRTMAATAETDCTLLEVDKTHFFCLITQTPLFAVRVLKTMADRLRRMNRQVKRITRFARQIAPGYQGAELLMNASDLRQYAKDEFIFCQNEPGKKMFCVKTGQVQLKVNGIPVETLGAGGILGEMALIEDKPRSATAVAMIDSELLVIDQERFELLLGLIPTFSIQIMQALSRRLWQLDQNIE